MRLSENPIFRREISWSGPPVAQLLRLPVICMFLACLWIGFLALLYVTSMPDPWRIGGQMAVDVFQVASILKAPVFLAGLIAGLARFSRDRRNKAFQDLYFTALDSREIVNAKLAALCLPVLALLFAGMLAMLIYIIAASVGEFPAAIRLAPRSSSLRLEVWLPAVPAFVGRVLLAGLVFVSGAIGGMKLALVKSPGGRMPEVFLQLAILLMVLCCCEIFAVLNVSGYRRLVDEFWWHTVYLEEDRLPGRGRLFG